MGGLDWAEKLLPSLVPPSVALVSPWALPPQPGIVTTAWHCHHGLTLPWGSASQLQRREHWIHLCTGSTTTPTPQFPKNPTETPPSLVKAG